MAKDQFGIPKYGKSAAPKRKNYGFGSSDHLTAAGNMAQNKLQSQLSVPHQEDIDADLYGNLNKKIGDRPSLASGFLSGLESSSRGKANEKRRGDLEKYEKVMGYLQQVNADATARIDEQKKEEALKGKYLPEVLTYLRSTTKLDPQSQLATAQSMFKRYAQESGMNVEVLGVDSTDPAIITLGVPGSPDSGTTRVDLRDFFADNQQVQQELALLSPEYQAMLQQKREQQAIENQQEAQRLYLRGEAINSADSRNDTNYQKFLAANDPEHQFKIVSGKQQGKEAAVQLTKYENLNEELYEVSDRVHDLKSLLKDANVITGDTLRSKAERFFGKITGSKAYSDTELYDAIAGGLFSYVKGQEKYGNLNQNEFSFLTGRIPTSEKTKAAALSLLNQFERRLERNIQRNNQKISKIPYYGSSETGESSVTAEEPIISNTQIKSEPLPAEVPEQQPAAQGKVSVETAPYKNKDGIIVKRIVQMTPEEAQEAVKNGGKTIQ